MLLSIHPNNPEPRKIQQVVEVLKAGGVIIYPTDTVYGLGCDMANKSAVEKLCKIRRLDPAKAMLTFVCRDIAQLSEYAWQLDNNLFRLLKKNLPGPFTFILKSSNAAPKLMKNHKRTIGARVPDHRIVMSLLEQLGRPMLSISLKEEEVEDVTYLTDPDEIHNRYGKLVDLVVDGGEGGSIHSTVVDCTVEPVLVVREGLGILE